MLTDGEKVASYIRWSTEEQAEGTTLEVQRDACRHFILAQGWRCREDLVFVDDGYSGGRLDRPGLTALREAVQQGDVTCVVVFKLDRLSRSVLDTVSLVLDEWDGLCYVKSTREPVDTTSPAGKMFFYMLASYAEWERSVIRERTMAGKAKRAQQGKNPGFTAPYGYRRGERPGELLLVAEEAAVVRRLFEEYLAGRSLHAIAAGLTADGVRPRRAPRWTATTVAQMLANPIYTGALVYGRSSLVSGRARQRDGRARIRHDAPRYAEVAGALPAIVTAAEFRHVQAMRGVHGARPGRKPLGAAFLLAGIASCRCGARLRGDTRGASGQRYYRCARDGSDDARCDSGLMPAALLERAVVQQVLRRWGPQLRRQGMEEERAAAVAAAEGEGARARRRLADLARREERLNADYAAGDLPASLYATQVDNLRAERERAQDQLTRADREAALLKKEERGAAPAVEVDPWDGLSADEQRQFLRLTVRGCSVYRPSESACRERDRPIEVRMQVVMATWATSQTCSQQHEASPPTLAESQPSAPARGAG